MSKEISPSRNVAIKAFTTSFKLLMEAGGSMVRKELFDQLKEKIKFTSVPEHIGSWKMLDDIQL